MAGASSLKQVTYQRASHSRFAAYTAEQPGPRRFEERYESLLIGERFSYFGESISIFVELCIWSAGFHFLVRIVRRAL